MRLEGSDGGHNGLSSIIYELGTEDFARLRCGIGSDFPRGGQVNYVLSRFKAGEIATVEEMTEFPILEDAISIQFALMQILRELLKNKLDPKHASLMLFALQIACMNRRGMRAERLAEGK